jgi:hypothetical protein
VVVAQRGGDETRKNVRRRGDEERRRDKKGEEGRRREKKGEEGKDEKREYSSILQSIAKGENWNLERQRQAM